MDDNELDASLMDELMENMGEHDKKKMFPKVKIEISMGDDHKEPDGDETINRREGMLPKPDELNKMVNKAKA